MDSNFSRGTCAERSWRRASEGRGARCGEAYGTPEQVRAIAEAAAGRVSSAEFCQTAVEQGWATGEELAVLRAALINWAERPDAYTDVLKCGALGWVSR
jgi:hypothetical protein